MSRRHRYTLVKTDITIVEIDKADDNLHLFVAEVQEIFGIEAMTYNIHSLTHLGE